MKVAFQLLSFFLAVCAAQKRQVFFVLEGEDFRSSFNIQVPGYTQVYLCRQPCEPRDMLMQVHDLRTKSGRYDLRMDGDVKVAITQVTKQDTGTYTVGVRSGNTEKHVDFELKVKDLCDGGVNRNEECEFLVFQGSDLIVPCDLNFAPRNRKFLCREDCTAFLIETNDIKGYSVKYGLEYVSQMSFRAIIRNLSVSDAGRYRCGVGRENGPNICQEFTVRIQGTIDSNHVKPEVPVTDFRQNLTEEGCHQTVWTSVALPIFGTLLVVILITQVMVLIQVRRKHGRTQTHQYENTNVPTRSATSQPAPYDNAVAAYASLNPETRENNYSTIQLQSIQNETDRQYVRVY